MTQTRPAPPTQVRTQGLSTTSDGHVVPTAYQRLCEGPPADRLAGWVVTLGVTALAALVRLWNLGAPNRFLFDETYYAKDGWSLWLHGYARNWNENANDAITGGDYSPGLMQDSPEFVVHPEIGKWLIGAGEHVFGFDAFGWRIASAVTGTLMVLVLVRLTRRLTRSTLLGGLAGVLLALDGMALVLSRLALLDIFVAFFLLCAVSCLVADRDWGRNRLARAVGPGWRPSLNDWGPVRALLWRPWRLSAGVMFGLAISCKWSALIPLAGFGLLVVFWDAGARRMLGVRRAFLRASIADGLLAVGYLVGVAVVVYVASWAGWIMHVNVFDTALSDNAYGPYWGDYTKTAPSGFVDTLVHGLRSLAHYHRDMWQFHTNGLDGVTHSYASDSRGWLILNRPVSVMADSGIRPGSHGCDAPADSTCIREILILGNPVIWWAGAVALLHSVYSWIAKRDWRHGLVIVGVLTTWVPFFAQNDRPIFSSYAITVLPFLIISIVLALGRILGPAAAAPQRRLVGATVIGAYLVTVAVAFAWFWPIYTGELLTTPEWLDRIWFKSWL